MHKSNNIYDLQKYNLRLFGRSFNHTDCIREDGNSIYLDPTQFTEPKFISKAFMPYYLSEIKNAQKK